MANVLRIVKNDTVYAVLVRHSSPSPGAYFFTDPSWEFQVGILARPAGYQVRPHTHPSREILVKRISEFVYIERGAVRVTVYDDAWEVLAQDVLRAGDSFLFLAGGHSLDVLEDSHLIEVKQGPFPGDSMSKIFCKQ